MNILYIGDVMGRAGVDTVAKVLPGLKAKESIDLVIAQSENVTDGRGMSTQDMLELQDYGIDFFTGGNWSVFRDDTLTSEYPVTRPANYPEGTPGDGYRYVQTNKGTVLVVSLLGKIVGKDADKPLTNPLQMIDTILQDEAVTERAATIVNFHGDFSSEKRIIGYYLDGRVSAVIGDHWHVPTNDAMVLPAGTAHITDVGMCGSLHSSLGVELDIVIPRWRDGKVNRNILATKRPYQFNAVLIKTNEKGLADSIKHIQQIID